MSFLDRVKGTLDAATRKSQDVLEINKLNQQIKKLEEKAEGLYQSIGRRVYQDPALAKQETRDYIEGQTHDLERLHRQIHDAKGKTLFLKDLIECAICKKVMSVQLKYCPDCGNNIADSVRIMTQHFVSEEQHKKKD